MDYVHQSPNPDLSRLKSQLLRRLRFGSEGRDSTGEADSRSVSHAEYREFELRMEMLPYALCAALDALGEIARRTQNMVSKMAQRGVGLMPGTVYGVQDEDRNSIGYAVDAFLDSAVRAQNAAASYVNVTLQPIQRSLSALSMEKAVRSIRDGNADIPSVIGELYTTYWARTGHRLKQYRDLAQHFTVVSSEALVFLGEENQPVAFLGLPTNPEITALQAISYGPPHVLAYEYAVSTYLSLYSFVYELSYHLLGLTGPADEFIMSVLMKAHPPLGQIAGCRVLAPPEFRRVMLHVRERLAARLKGGSPADRGGPTGNDDAGSSDAQA